MLDADRARRAHAILTAALETPRHERDAMIARACAGDTALHERVRKLLSAAERSDDFLESPPLQRRMLEASAVPDAVGTYVVVGVLGAGGMATVYEAVQENPHRHVALKVLHHSMTSTDAFLRFRLEAETLARLRHPGIAQIYEAGTAQLGLPSPSPFIAMELVPGAMTITAYARHTAMPLRERLTMFAAVCDAVLYGHQNGVIHRDIKPGNILVGSDGLPKVIDFGIARTIGASSGSAGITAEASRSGLLGTLNAMSPEQCLTPESVDARADVYSLGVVLYELVTGRLPHDLAKVSIPEAVRIICEQEPNPPSAHNALARGDLDAVIAKAMHKDRDRRYPGPAALADDLRRHLAMLPIEARPRGAFYSIGKFARRNRAASIAIAAAVLALVAGVAVSSGMAFVAARARDQAQLRERELEIVKGFQESVLSGIDVQRMGEGMRARLSQAAADAARGALSEPEASSAAAEASQRLERELGPINFTSIAIDAIRGSILDRYRKSIDEQFASQPALRARLLLQLADTMRKFALYKEAEPAVRESLAVRRELHGPDHIDTLTSANALASLLSIMGRFDEAREILLDTRERLRRTVGDEHPVSIRVGGTLGGVHRRTGDLAGAEREWSHSLALRRKVFGDDHPETLATLNNLGITYADQGRAREAETVFRELLDRRRRTSGEDSPEYRSSLGNLGVLLQDQSRFDEARELIERALAADRRRFGDRHANTLTSIAQLGELLVDAGDPAAAVPVLREAYDGRTAALGPENIDTLSTRAFLGNVHRRLGDLDQAREFLLPALEAQRRLMGPTHPHTMRSLFYSADLARDAGRLDEALALNDEAGAVLAAVPGEGQGAQGQLWIQRGTILIALGRKAEGQDLVRRGIEMMQSVVGPDHPRVREAKALVDSFEPAPE